MSCLAGPIFKITIIDNTIHKYNRDIIKPIYLSVLVVFFYRVSTPSFSTKTRVMKPVVAVGMWDKLPQLTWTLIRRIGRLSTG